MFSLCSSSGILVAALHNTVACLQVHLQPEVTASPRFSFPHAGEASCVSSGAAKQLRYFMQLQAEGHCNKHPEGAHNKASQRM